jgi:hypothetical protein
MIAALNLLPTIHVMKVTKWSPLGVHDVAGESAIYYLHNNGENFTAKCLHDPEH